MTVSLDLADLLARWEARVGQLADLRPELAQLEMSRILGYRDAWLTATRDPTMSSSTWHKVAEADVAPLAAEAVRLKADITVIDDEITYLKAACHSAGRG